MEHEDGKEGRKTNELLAFAHPLLFCQLKYHLLILLSICTGLQRGLLRICNLPRHSVPSVRWGFSFSLYYRRATHMDKTLQKKPSASQGAFWAALHDMKGPFCIEAQHTNKAILR